jgi:hypothetical protein
MPLNTFLEWFTRPEGHLMTVVNPPDLPPAKCTFGITSVPMLLRPIIASGAPTREVLMEVDDSLVRPAHSSGAASLVESPNPRASPFRKKQRQRTKTYNDAKFVAAAEALIKLTNPATGTNYTPWGACLKIANDMDVPGSKEPISRAKRIHAQLSLKLETSE